MIMRIRRLFNLAADSDGGAGGDPSIKALGDEIVATARATKQMTEELHALKDDVRKVSADSELSAAKINAEVALIRASLKESHGGVSGADDWMNELSKFVSAVWQQRVHGRVDPSMSGKAGLLTDVLEKAAVSFSTVYNSPSGSTAGYLLPEMLRPGVIEMSDVYGSLYPLLTKLTVPAGQKIRIPAESAQPVAAWRTIQASVALGEEGTPAAFADYSILTEILYVVQKASNELMQNPSVGFGAVLASMALRAITKKLEVDFLGGVTGSNACPSASMVATATNSGTTTAVATFAHVVDFLQAAVANDPSAFETAEKMLFMHPKDVLTLATQPVSSTNLPGALVWGDPRTGAPTTLLGYRLVPHYGCVNQATSARNMFLFDPRKCFLGEDAAFGIDFSDHVLFQYNATMLRFMNHYDWCIPVPSEAHRIIVTDS